MPGLKLVCAVVVAALVAGSCGGGDPDTVSTDEPQPTAVEPAATPEPTLTPEPTPVPSSTAIVEPTAVPEPTPVPGIAVEDLFDGEGAREATVTGFVLIDAGSTRLCDVLMESFPPQCGWAWIVIANPDALAFDFDETNGIAWTPSPVQISGFFDGNRFLVEGGAPDVTPTTEDLALAEAFVRFAATGEGFDEIPFGEEVALGLSDQISETVASADLAAAEAWVIQQDEFRARAGPFSALELASADFDVTVGAHARCVGPPVPPPPGFESDRRVSIQPSEATSCIEWYTIDFFVDAAGHVVAITFDLFEP